MQSQPLLSFTLTNQAPGVGSLVPMVPQGQGYTAKLASALSQQPTEFVDVFDSVAAGHNDLLALESGTHNSLPGLALPHLPTAAPGLNSATVAVADDGQALPQGGQTLPPLTLNTLHDGGFAASEQAKQVATAQLLTQQAASKTVMPADATSVQQAPIVTTPVVTPTGQTSVQPAATLSGDASVSTNSNMTVADTTGIDESVQLQKSVVESTRAEVSTTQTEQESLPANVRPSVGTDPLKGAVTTTTRMVSDNQVNDESQPTAVNATLSNVKLAESLRDENALPVLPTKPAVTDSPQRAENSGSPDELAVFAQRTPEQQSVAENNQQYLQETDEQLQAKFARLTVALARHAQDVMRVPQQIDVSADIEIVAGKTESGTPLTPTLAQAASSTRPTLQPTVPQLTLPTHIESLDWSKNFSDKVQQVLGNNVKQAEIRLDPPHLGKINVKIDMVNERTAISFHTDQSVVRDAIDNATNRLREQLMSAGFDKVDVDVSSGNANKQQHDQSGQQNRQLAGLEQFGRESEGTNGESSMADNASLGNTTSGLQLPAEGISLYA